MRHICVIGLSWGDEGKGKVVDVLTGGVDAVVRYQGGANAGHTICFGDKRHVLHHLPAGILHEGTQAILGNGMVIAPGKLLEEVSELPDEALERLHISERAHLVLPHHILLDRSRESGRKAKIGTTLRGIGPAYQEKYARTGVRLGDLLAPGFIEEGLRGHLAGGLEGLGAPPTAVDEAHDLCRRFAERLGARVGDTAGLLARLHRRGDRFLFEGAQGSLLDIDFGTYPYVTSSSSSFLGIGPGSGFSPRRVDHVLGVSKAYCTRVVEGPFPTELDGEEAERLRAAGEEYGATTG
ncbi:MAG: adenylosuccinate synthetase, partial [Planctomycetota bacterium]